MLGLGVPNSHSVGLLKPMHPFVQPLIPPPESTLQIFIVSTLFQARLDPWTSPFSLSVPVPVDVLDICPGWLTVPCFCLHALPCSSIQGVTKYVENIYTTDSRRRKKFTYGNIVIFRAVTLLSCATTVRNRYPVSMNQLTNPFLCFIRSTVFLLYKTAEPKQTTYFDTPCIFCPPLLRFVCSSASRSLSRCLMFVR